MEPTSTFSSDLNLVYNLLLTSSYIVIPSQHHGTLVLNHSRELHHKIETGSVLNRALCRENIYITTYIWEEPGTYIRVFDLDQKYAYQTDRSISRHEIANIGKRQKERTLTGLEGENHQWALLALSQNAKTLAAGTHHGEIMIWDLDLGISTPSKILPAYRGIVLAIEILDRKLITSSEGGTVQIWGLFTGSCLHTCHGQSNWVTTAQFDQDGRMATCDFGGLIKVWNLEDGRSIPLVYSSREIILLRLARRGRFASGIAQHGLLSGLFWCRAGCLRKDSGLEMGTSGFDEDRETTIQIWDLNYNKERPVSKVPLYGFVRHLKSVDGKVLVLSMSTAPIEYMSYTAVRQEFKVESWDMDAIIKEVKESQK